MSATGSTGEIEAALSKVSKLRDLTLRFLEIAGELELVPESRVRAIRAGTGKLDKVDASRMTRTLTRRHSQVLDIIAA